MADLSQWFWLQLPALDDSPVCGSKNSNANLVRQSSSTGL